MGEVCHWYRAAGCLYLLRWRDCSRSVLGPALTFKDTTITFALIGYAFVSALLPVWLIPRTARLSGNLPENRRYRRPGAGYCGANPELKMPAMTQYIDGTGPLWKGALFPFLVHHHRLWCGIWLPRADLFRYDAETAG
ncbi:carbon starvation CstA family protein [Escherichia coli]